VTLSVENNRQFFVPEGFAHGYCVLSETALFTYKCSDFYAPDCEKGILWCDPDINIDWPIEDPILSDKDQQYPCLRDVDSKSLPDWKLISHRVAEVSEINILLLDRINRILQDIQISRRHTYTFVEQTWIFTELLCRRLKFIFVRRKQSSLREMNLAKRLQFFYDQVWPMVDFEVERKQYYWECLIIENVWMPAAKSKNSVIPALLNCFWRNSNISISIEIYSV